jgi:ABC-type nitrate/sulfonate/bicarbonate transport system substrate-binding protein
MLHASKGNRTSLKSTVVLAAAALAVAACGSGSSSPQSSAGSSGAGGKIDQLTIITGGAGTYNAAFYIAKAMGFTNKVGLDLTIKNANGNAVTEVVAGQGDLGTGGAPAPLLVAAQGKPTSILYANSAASNTGYVIAAASVHKLTQCKTMAAPAVGSGSYAVIAAFKKASGATFTIRPFNDPTDVTTAVISGQFDCASTTLSVLGPALNAGKGLHLIVNAKSDPASVPPATIQGAINNVIWGLTDRIQSKKAAIVKLIKALLMATQYLKTASPQQVAQGLAKIPDLNGYTTAQLATLYGYDHGTLTPNNGFIPSSSWPITLRLFENGSAIQTNSPVDAYSARVDMSYYNTAAGR